MLNKIISKISSISSKNTISINGVNYKGNNVQVQSNGVVIIDGKEVSKKNTTVNITIEGNCGSLINDVGDVFVNGNIEGDLTVQTGDVSIGGDINNLKSSVGDVHIEGSVAGSAICEVGDLTIRNKS